MAVETHEARRAVFVDKDGTLVPDLPYNVDPRRIRLAPGAGSALARLQAAGYAVVLVSNQAGVARGVIGEHELEAVWRRLRELLGLYGVVIEAVYYCPHDPDGADPRYAMSCDCRKPRPGMLHAAAAAHGFDLARSWMIGDILDDIEAGRRAGCFTVLLDVGSETEWRPGRWRRPHCVATSFAQAAQEILRTAAAAPRMNA